MLVPALESLWMKEVDPSCRAPLQGLERLRHLILSPDGSFTWRPEERQELFDAWPNLESLTLDQTRCNVRFPCTFRLPDSLRSISWVSGNLSSSALPAASLSSIETLKLYRVHIISGVGNFITTFRFPTLQHLEISECWMCARHHSLNIPPEWRLTLKIVRLVRNQFKTDDTLKLPPNIVEWTIDWPTHSPDQAVELLQPGQHSSLKLLCLSAVEGSGSKVRWEEVRAAARRKGIEFQVRRKPGGQREDD